MRAVEIARRLCRKAKPVYLTALEQGDAVLAAAGINTPLRLAHFLAQIFHETGGGTVLEENMRYTAARIREVWPTRPEAVRFANDPEGLGNSVYAGRMGNGPPSSGDGYRYRGRGFMQTTGKALYEKIGKRLGVDLVANPEAILFPRYALLPAVYEWGDMGCNALADRNAIKQIGNAINRGNPNAQKPPIGHIDRVEWFNKIWALMKKEGAAPKAPAWQISDPDPDVRGLQEQLVALGYSLDVDGRKGPKTEKAIRAFQRKAGIPVDGVAGAVTRAALAAALEDIDEERQKAPVEESARPPLVRDAMPLGVKMDVAAAGGEMLVQQTEKLDPLTDALPGQWSLWARLLIGGLGIIGTLLIVYAGYRALRPRSGRAE
jgi:putative chitinase